MGVIEKSGRRQFEATPSFDVDLVMPVYQYVADRRVLKKRFEGSEAKNLVLNFGYERVSFICIERDVFFIENTPGQGGDIG
ncbi:MAG: hypothetical protein NZ990_03545 [Myxococcota bacterium]|nr:hypothetical protein [Myxococcota bacterium]